MVSDLRLAATRCFIVVDQLGYFLHIALGNILGSNLFNSLAVVGIAGTIHPLGVGPEVLSRDILVMFALTVSLFILGFGFRGPGRINRFEGAMLLICYVGYTVYLVSTVFVL